MKIFTILWSAIVTILATAIMSYICMATPIGPWIETTILLISAMVIHIFAPHITQRTQILGLSTVAAGMGGIIATACAFSFPTLFFLQPDLFNSWLSSPFYFCTLMAFLVITASTLGLLVAQVVEPSLLTQPNMPFSIGQLTQKMIVAQNQIKKSYELFWGLLTSTVLVASQSIFHILPSSICLIPRFSFSCITIQQIVFKLDLFPMFLAIGFITGKMLAVPLLVGVISKIFILEPLHKLAFSYLTSENFLLAFFSGMVIQGALMSFADFPSLLRAAWSKFNQKTGKITAHKIIMQQIPWYVLLATCCITIPFLYYFKFSFIAQLYLLSSCILCIYQLIIIAGKIGLAPLGRFATFVMVPGLLIFGFNAVQATLTATFVEISGGVAVDALFGRKMGQLAAIDRKYIVWYQIFGVFVSAISIGIIFWGLINHFGLSSAELFAQRAQSRAVLINAYTFDYYVLFSGAIFGFILKYFKVNSVLVLGGLAMSIDVSLVLILGGFIASRIKNAEEYYSFWSGVFASSSLWMILKTLF